jgi:prepilin-type N-terminal cleavage/methylation domain-containing protein
MRKGFTLIEVMIALCIIMICVLTTSKLSLISFQSKSYGEHLTNATILGNSRLDFLQRLPMNSPELRKSWHRDPMNPIRKASIEYYRFWLVDDLPKGKEVTIYVAWHDKQMGMAHNFGSPEDLMASRCPRVDMGEFINKE